MPITYMTPSRIEYQYGDRSTTVQGEAMAPAPGGVDYVVYAFSIKKWNPPHQDIAMTAAEQNSVLEAVCNELRAKGTVVDVEGLEYMHGLQVGTPTSVAAQHLCPASGYWFTPAKQGSRRYFFQHESMPNFVSSYGSVIWQWDVDQSTPDS
jgi:Immunity protein 74